MAERWSRDDLNTIGHNMAWDGIRRYNEGRPFHKGASMRAFVEKHVYADKTVKNIIRQTKDTASIQEGIDRALSDFAERKEKEPNITPTGSAWYQNKKGVK